MTPVVQFVLALVLLVSITSFEQTATQAQGPISPVDAEIDHFLAVLPVAESSADAVNARCDAGLALVRKAETALERRSGVATIADDYKAYDSLTLIVGDVTNDMTLLSETSRVKAVRDAAEACLPKVSAIGTEIGLSRPIYERLSAIPTKGLDPKTAFALNRQLLEYRLTGVDRDEATRARIKQLNTQITEQGVLFEKNIRDDKGDIALRPEDLQGLPQDYLTAHKADAGGTIHVTYDYPDLFPILDFASARGTRKKALTAFFNRGWPANEAVLKSLLQKRYELAQVLGYRDYAQLVTVDKMIGTPERAARFLDDINAAAMPGANGEAAELLAFAKGRDPSIDRLETYDNSYMTNLLRKERYDVDAATVRQYFTLAKTQAGIFNLIHDLFGADVRPWKTAVWSSDVSAWELYDGSRVVGRFYLDLSPREGKYSHAAQFPIRTGVEGRQLPVGALVTNFPAEGPMGHSDVTTFLHEFGHLIHAMYSGHTDYSTQAMGNLPWDFIEAPSQMLEEWTWNYETLKGFASNNVGQPIPESLVKRMNAGRHFGEPTQWKGQLAFSAVSLNFYNRKPDFDLQAMFDQQITRYSMFPPIPGTHFYASFEHLNEYSAIYYTYIWSKAIALDLFTRFEAEGVRNAQTATRYRTLVLEPGASEDANQQIENFLGRPLSVEAFKKELQKR